MSPADRRIGIDVGVATVSAVALDHRDRLVGWARVAATDGAQGGIAAAVTEVVGASGVSPGAVGHAILGAGVSMRRAVTQRRLQRVAVLRIGAPLTLAVPPLATWPADLRAAVSAGETIVAGGGEPDGRPAAALDEDAIARFLEQAGAETQTVAITGVFSPVDPEQELAAADVVRRELGPGVHVSLSHEIGSLGLLERENAAVLNGALVGTAQGLAEELAAALEAWGVVAELSFAQNDGAIMALEHAVRFPVLMLAAGPASAMRGAAFLTGLQDAVVAEVGPTSIAVGALANGWPRESTSSIAVEGIHIACCTADVVRVPTGDESLMAGAVNRARSSSSLPLVVVGGAAERLSAGVSGIGEVLRPDEGHVATAIGATIAPVGGQADRICPDRPDRRRTGLREATAAAYERTVQAGADPDAIEVVEVQEQPVGYLADPAVRIRVRAAGPRR